jgi:hypothetical protein
MIRLHAARPKCSRKDLSCVDSSLFLCVVGGEYTFIYFDKKEVTRILSIFHWDISCGEVLGIIQSQVGESRLLWGGFLKTAIKLR